MQALRALCVLGVSCACLLAGCGDDDGGPERPPLGKQDSGPPDASEAGDGGGGGGGGNRADGGGGTAGGGDRTDSGMDADIVDPPFDAAGDFKDGNLADDEAGPVPDDWSCLEDLWTDGICDCGCSARDFDCVQSSCSDPGCKEDNCGACFAVDGTFMSCLPEPDASDWTCNVSQMSDGLCDCGCGIPDPACGLSACTSPGCSAAGCQVRNGCSDVVTPDEGPNDPGAPCEATNPTLTAWTCAIQSYGGSDGCDCGCGMIDPDCGGEGCKAGRCFDDACTTCHDEEGRPYACEAAEAGWDEDTTDGSPLSLDSSHCNALRFDAGDGCDCGCGGIDPDCDDAGCSPWGCSDDACDRCTDGNGSVTGCADAEDATVWVEDNSCDLDNYGMDDGCDCGCGTPDPDCNGDGSVSSEFTNDCDVCHDGVGGFEACPDWDENHCSVTLIANGECDCGCGVVDPDCRVLERESCTEPGCELTTCQFCNEDETRSACGGEWQSDLFESACAVSTFDRDGLCDCGCGVADPDCGDDEGCTEKGCSAPGCEVCHDGYLLTQCLLWFCDEGRFGGDDECDCGCGARDSDCEDGGGCTQVGCLDAACDVCHDPFGRPSPCPEAG